MKSEELGESLITISMVKYLSSGCISIVRTASQSPSPVAAREGDDGTRSPPQPMAMSGGLYAFVRVPFTSSPSGGRGSTEEGSVESPVDVGALIRDSVVDSIHRFCGLSHASTRAAVATLSSMMYTELQDDEAQYRYADDGDAPVLFVNGVTWSRTRPEVDGVDQQHVRGPPSPLIEAFLEHTTANETSKKRRLVVVESDKRLLSCSRSDSSFVDGDASYRGDDCLFAEFLCGDAYVEPCSLHAADAGGNLTNFAFVPLLMFGQLPSGGGNVVRHYAAPPLVGGPLTSCQFQWGAKQTPPPALVTSLNGALREICFKVGLMPKYGA
jgi:hypothetical protein